ncbi:Smr/MutS family protein [Roseiarcaceae bacterium H3SJ34-1]|uniref:Smr/MutS family protein n=1 Tax=Terripilifer ovatus TaxID=3032367 RepID=UPI003AB97BC6|nr:Smr/MutS family protein [Roseiarcaceae bacterium H3SJ34-1]
MKTRKPTSPKSSSSKPTPSTRHKRLLARHEIELWNLVTRHVKPFREAKPVEPPPAEEAKLPAVPPPPGKMERPAKKGQLIKANKPVPVPPPPALAPLERRMRQRLTRGRLPIDATLDLHGMHQAVAHAELVSFLHRAQAAGARVVLVITGKGLTKQSSDGGEWREPGVLRRNTPHWLRSPQLRSVVVGFEEASVRHGGAGALYVRLRRHERNASGSET